LCVPTFGYLSTLNYTPSIVITRPMPHGQDIFQIVAVAAVMIVQLVKILVMIVPFKFTLH